MGEGLEHNPFAPPAEHADFEMSRLGQRDYLLATYGQRLGAYIIDNLLAIPTVIPFFLFVDFDDIDFVEESNNALGLPPRFLVLLIGPFLLACYQWTMTATTGQTIAKRWLRTRVVREGTGAVPGFVNGVLLRNWLFSLAGMMPGIGGCIGLADALVIFSGNTRQTLHDRVARTIVIQE